MEGGSPHLIRERWTLPLYYDQCRYWADHPPVDLLLAARFGVKVGKKKQQKRGGGIELDAVTPEMQAKLNSALGRTQ